MGKKSRDKGATFERWLVNEMKDNLGENLLEQPSRNLSQYQQKGQSDIIIPGFAFEAKAYAKGYTHKKDWWVQACEQAGDLEPVLVYKYDYQEPRAVISLSLVSSEYQGTGMTCAISLPTLWYIVREKLAERG
ncbi:MAG: putative protein D14 [Prokaryotic dsDNA virus sp.]|nr:MAG: putative protein D14 [Prokaryotic dsDNA virus sp.]|tara:strand:+ start:742 stop:1140 length:399 start_codon:yes stop_codon:yes gene_type:complete